MIEAQRRALPAPRNNLPEPEPHFQGRGEDEAALLDGLARGGGSQATTALRGVGGIGKTALAVRVAHQMLLLYPDAQQLVDLRGT